MKKIFTLIIFICIFISNVKAAPGDTTIVPVHILDSLTYYGTYTRQAQLPNNNATYRKIFLLYTIGRYQCPAGAQYCGQWDYSLDFIAKPLNPAVSVEEFEIARGITPYAGSGGVFNLAWTHTYYIDITDFAPILKDSLQLMAQYSGYSGGFTLATNIMYIEGTPEKEAIAIHKVQKGYYGYGGVNSIEDNLIPDTTQIVAPATNADMLISITGHGNDNTGCSEFCEKYYTLSLNGTQIAQNDFWKKCGFCDIQAQTGTWVYDRGGWCPGEKVLAYRHHLPGVTAGTPFIVDMDMEAYTGSNGGAGYSVASYVISYKAPAFSLDAEVEDIITPSAKNDYKKFNPNCTNPTIIIKNGGTTDLTSATIQYGIAGQVIHTFPWTGNLKFMETAIVTLPSIAWANEFADSTQFVAFITTPNGGTDEYAANDTARSMYQITPVLPASFVLQLSTNNTAVTSGGPYNETSWQLFDQSGNIVKERINNPNSSLLYDTLNLAPGCYQLKVIDEGWEDGLSWWVYPNYPTNPGSGSIKFRNISNGSVYSENTTKLNRKYYTGDFGSKFLYNFKVDYPLGNSHIDKENFQYEIYPNPASEQLNVSLVGIKSETIISLINTNGEILASQKVNHSTNISFDVKNLSQGIYFVKISNNAQSEVKKVLVFK